MNKKRLLIILFLLVCHRVFAVAYQDPFLNPQKSMSQYKLKNWQTEDGLPQNSVTSIIQTTDGYLWLGTYNGLCRFDGFSFSTLDTLSKSPLSNAYINALYEDRDGGLWIGTRSKGLAFLKNNHLKIFTDKDGLPDNNINSISQDSSGTLWIGTYGKGLVTFKNGVFTTYPHPANMNIHYIETIFTDRFDTVWIGTNGSGILKYKDGRFHTLSQKNGLRNGHIRDIIRDSHDRVWIATSGGGITILDHDTIRHLNTDNGLSSNVILTLYQDNAGTVWIGTEGGGLDRYVDGKISNFSADNGLSNDVISDLYEDNQGDLWMGTLGGGLNRFRDGKFTSYTTREGLSNNFIWTVFVDSLGEVWAGTDGDGVNIIRGNKISVLNHKNGLSGDFIRTIYQDHQGRTWIGTYKGLTILDHGKSHILNKNNGLADDVVLSLYADHHNNMWIGTSGGGLQRFKDGKFTNYTTHNGLPNNYIRAIYEDHKGNIWIGTSGGGFSVLHNGKFSNYDVSDGLSNNIVISFYEDKDGTMWIGTHGGGLSRFKNEHFSNFTIKDGLLDDIIFSIFEDQNGYLWMSSNKGIFKVNRNELNDMAQGNISHVHSIVYGKADGMISTECNGANQPAGWQDKEGRLWYPTVSGVSMINPNKLRINTTPPIIHIKKAVADDHLDLITHPDALRPGSHKIDFTYTAISLNTIDNVQFKYRLMGFDKQWISAGNRRNAYYTNLQPGTYEFKVIACNSDNIWNLQGATLSFVIPTPFYETYWAYAGYIILLFLAILGVVQWQAVVVKKNMAIQFEKEQFRLRAEQEHLQRIAIESKTRERENELKLKAQENETNYQKERRKMEKMVATAFSRGIEEERSRIAIELHDQILGSLSNVMRRIQSSLRRKPDENKGANSTDKVLPELDLISQNIRVIMDDLKPGTIEFFGLVDSLEELIRKHIDSSERTIKFQMNVPDKITNLNYYTKITIYRIFQEAINNAIQHGEPGNIELSIHRSKDCVVFELIDDGKGFEFEETMNELHYRNNRSGHGLMNMIHRANTISAKIHWIRNDLSGTRMKLTVPI